MLHKIINVIEYLDNRFLIVIVYQNSRFSENIFGQCGQLIFYELFILICWNIIRLN